MPRTVDELTALFELERLEVDLFRGSQPATSQQRAFGGQVMGQALEAAYTTVPEDRLCHSLHGYFLRPGSTSAPIIYTVSSPREGRSFSSRHVEARQHGATLFVMNASFKIPEDGLEHQWPPTAGVPDPEDCPPLSEVLGRRSQVHASTWEDEWGAMDVRYAGDHRKGDYTSRAAMQVWLRVPERLPDDPKLHQGLLAYASDLTLLGVTTVGHPVEFMSADMQMATIDHAMWFHRPIRIDQWIMYDQFSPSASNGVGYARGRLYADGLLGVSTAQEGLIRVLSKEKRQQAAEQRQAAGA